MLARGTERTKLLTLVESSTNRDYGGGEEKFLVPVDHVHGNDVVEYRFDLTEIAAEEPEAMDLYWYARLTILPLIRLTAEVRDGKCSFSVSKAALARGASLTLYALKVKRHEALTSSSKQVAPTKKTWTSSKPLTTWPLAVSRGILPLQLQPLDGVLWRVRYSAGEDFKPIIDWNEQVPVSLARRPEIKNTMLPGILYQIAYELLRRSQAGTDSAGSVEEQWRHLIPGTSIPSSDEPEDAVNTEDLADMAAKAVENWGVTHPEHLVKLVDLLETLGDDE